MSNAEFSKITRGSKTGWELELLGQATIKGARGEFELAKVEKFEKQVYRFDEVGDGNRIGASMDAHKAVGAAKVQAGVGVAGKAALAGDKAVNTAVAIGKAAKKTAGFGSSVGSWLAAKAAIAADKAAAAAEEQARKLGQR